MSSSDIKSDMIYGAAVTLLLLLGCGLVILADRCRIQDERDEEDRVMSGPCTEHVFDANSNWFPRRCPNKAHRLVIENGLGICRCPRVEP